ncbi:hypothetical protein ACHT8Q_11355 [Stutzerimonas degradans]
MNLPIRAQDTAISKLGDTYENVAGPALVALLTLINPAFGASAAAIGALLSYGNSQRAKIKQEYLASQIKKQLEQHKNSIHNLNENLHEAIILAIQGVQSAVSTDKINRFAKIISGHIINSSSWDETATALRAIASLEDIHIQIISEASLHINTGNGQAKFYIETPNFPKPGMIDGRSTAPTLNILTLLTGRSHTEVEMFCMELMSKGLLHDNGQGSFDKGPVYTLTPAAFWLLQKIESMES